MTRPMWRYLAISAVSFGAIGVAHSLQVAWALAPCTMCIAQRYAFAAMGVTALIRAFLPENKGFVLGLLLNLFAVVGLLASARIQWALSVPSVSCGRDQLADFLNELPWVSHWPTMFEATGICGDTVPPVLGLPFHIWSAMLFTLFMSWAFHGHTTKGVAR